MVPLRRALVVERRELIYPEGVACAEVLIAGQKGGKDIRLILAGLGIGALFKFLVTGLHVVKSVVEGAVGVGRSVLYFGSDMSVALVAVGYIVRLPIASLIFLGGVIGWVVTIPMLGAGNPMWRPRGRLEPLVNASAVHGCRRDACRRPPFNMARPWRYLVRGGGDASCRGNGSANDTEAQPRTERDMPLAALLLVFLPSVFGTFSL